MFKYKCSECALIIEYKKNMAYECPKCNHNIFEKISMLPRQYNV